MRPRCCFRNLTFFGINMMQTSNAVGYRLRAPGCRHCLAPGPTPPVACSLGLLRPGSLHSRRPTRTAIPVAAAVTVAVFLFAPNAWPQPLALVQPDLHADLPVGRVAFGEAVVDVGAQRLQRQLAVQVPLGSC